MDISRAKVLRNRGRGEERAELGKERANKMLLLSDKVFLHLLGTLIKRGFYLAQSSFVCPAFVIPAVPPARSVLYAPSRWLYVYGLSLFLVFFMYRFVRDVEGSRVVILKVFGVHQMGFSLKVTRAF